MPGLRERKKTATRAAIARAALARFAENGYGAVTIAEVAAAAEVSERTLFRYFADKEELLFAEDEAYRTGLANALAEQPADAAPVAVLVRGAAAILDALEPRREEMRARTAIIDTVPSLQARERGKHVGLEAVLADGLTTRGIDPADARLLARIAIACSDEALRTWLADNAVTLTARYTANLTAVGRLLA